MTKTILVVNDNYEQEGMMNIVNNNYDQILEKKRGRGKGDENELVVNNKYEQKSIITYNSIFKT